MPKIPAIAIDQVPLEVWFEGSHYVVVYKPAGMRTHPDNVHDRGTLANALFQSNRWLAEMETSTAPGLIYAMRDQDQGLMVWAKDDEAGQALRQQHQQREFKFFYRAQAPRGAVPVGDPSVVQTASERDYAGVRVWDIDAFSGDTAQLAAQWWGPELGSQVQMTCYAVELPSGHRVALADRIALPELELYTAPP